MDKKPTYNGSLYKHSELTEQIIGAFYAVYFGPKPETKRRSFDNTWKEWWIAQNKSESTK